MTQVEAGPGLLGQAIKELEGSKHPNDVNVSSLLAVALAMRGEAGDIYPINTSTESLSTPEELVEASSRVSGAATWTSPEKRLELATAEWLANLASRNRVTEFYNAHWDLYGIEMGLSERDRSVDQAPYSDEEIYQFMKLNNPQPGNPGVDLPYFHLPVLALNTEEARLRIGRGFANLGTSWAFQSGYKIKNGHETSGWMRVDASLDAPYRLNQNDELTGLNVNQLKAAIADDKRSGETVNIYGPSGNVIKVVFDYYPDQGSTWSRLPESVESGRVLDAGFFPDGGFRAGSRWDRGDRLPGVGGRSFLGA